MRGWKAGRKNTLAVVLAGSGGVVNSLTFTQHRLSPLAVFTSGVYFLYSGRR